MVLVPPARGISVLEPPAGGISAWLLAAEVGHLDRRQTAIWQPLPGKLGILFYGERVPWLERFVGGIVQLAYVKMTEGCVAGCHSTGFDLMCLMCFDLLFVVA